MIIIDHVQNSRYLYNNIVERLIHVQPWVRIDKYYLQKKKKKTR
jgi:hypothetical protein